MNKDSIFALAKRKSQKLEFPGRIDFSNVTFVSVDLQFAFQVPDTAFQQCHGRSFTFTKQYDIIGVSDHRHASSLVFMVKFIQVDIGE